MAGSGFPISGLSPHLTDSQKDVGPHEGVELLKSKKYLLLVSPGEFV